MSVGNLAVRRANVARNLLGQAEHRAVLAHVGPGHRRTQRLGPQAPIAAHPNVAAHGSAYRKDMESWGMIARMSRAGDCYDNAPKESFWATLKKELMSDVRFATHEEARQANFEYIEVSYNRQRIHGSLDYVSPEEFEASRR